jgi:hypothetical protein
MQNYWYIQVAASVRCIGYGYKKYATNISLTSTTKLPRNEKGYDKKIKYKKYCYNCD